MSHLHAIECLAIPLLPPLPRLSRTPELHEHHVFVCPARLDEAEVRHVFPRSLSHKAQEVGWRHVGWHRQDAKCSAVLLVEVRGSPLNVLVQARRLLPIAVEVHHTPADLCIP